MILKNGRIYFYSDVQKMNKLPVGNYLLMYDEKVGEYYLEGVSEFRFPTKIYGDDEVFCDRVLNTFNKTYKNIGVLLTGMKGSGKSMCAKLIAHKSQLPVIIITQPYVGDSFMNVIEKIGDDAVLFFDEFEKVYKETEHQEQFLSILDGVFTRKKLFLFTTNTFKINEFLKSRPSRIRYLRKYDGLSAETIEQVVDDLLEDKSKKSELIHVMNILSSVSIDVLLHLIEEMNLYNESARAAIKNLNVQIEHSHFDVQLYLNGKLYTSKVDYNPLASKNIYMSYRKYSSEYGGDIWGYYSKSLEEMGVQIMRDGTYEFRDRDQNKIVFVPSKPFGFEI